jgi:hypothetical protein
METANKMPELIVMLTHQDKTVPDALALFNQLKDEPVKHWGFKDVGLEPDQMGEVVAAMKAAGKQTYLEVVSLSEEDGLTGARLAVELGFAVLMGTVCYPSILAYLSDKPINYYPFPGRVHGHPSILDGTIDEIVAHARQLESQGAHGLDLLAYRYTGNAPDLLSKVVEATSVPVVSAGSIGSFERIREVRVAGAWGFTIGSAFFESQFVPDGDFHSNLSAVVKWLQTN